MEAKSHFLFAASELLWGISSKSNSFKSKLGTITTELRVRSFNFLESQKDKFYLCPKCNTPWREGLFKMRVKSIKIPSKIKKLIQRSPASTSSYKSKLLDSYTSKRDNVMVLRCLVCENITKCNITKQKVEIPVSIVPEKENQSTHIKKKKKKRKDILAGLKIKLISTKKKEVLDINIKESNVKQIQVNSSISVSHKNPFNTKEMKIQKLPFNTDKVDSMILNTHITESDNDVREALTTRKIGIFTEKDNELCKEHGNNKTRHCLIRNNDTISSDNIFKKNESLEVIDVCSEEDNRHKHKNTELSNLKKKKKKKKLNSLLKNKKQINTLKSELKEFIDSL